MKRYWFKNKRFGIGWTPATWEGWLCIGVFILWVIGIMLRFETLGFSESATLEQFVYPVFFGVFVLIVVSAKTGEPLQWRFGTTRTIVSHLHQQPFLDVLSGSKKVEVCLYDEKRQGFKVGDRITFVSRENPSQKVTKSIAALNRFSTFAELYVQYPQEKTDIYTYYSKEDEQRYGVVAIELE